MPGCTVHLKVVLPHWQQYHGSTADDLFDLLKPVIFFTQRLQSTHSVGKELNDTIGLELALTDDLGGKEKNKESDGLNGDLDAK
jgi:hypothetical protein